MGVSIERSSLFLQGVSDKEKKFKPSTPGFFFSFSKNKHVRQTISHKFLGGCSQIFLRSSYAHSALKVPYLEVYLYFLSQFIVVKVPLS